MLQNVLRRFLLGKNVKNSPQWGFHTQFRPNFAQYVLLPKAFVFRECAISLLLFFQSVLYHTFNCNKFAVTSY
ncbi:hypothetical protein A0H81_02354 [Grifola frondosa]|uniref:Uncharacterized protein n=1 Tax=Grifola frondosa TaxID=5627 RepID=A0A1C7MLU5_GRIFR|nr:hypothetical protein A0H81_02354 [Grifola frondosa]